MTCVRLLIYNTKGQRGPTGCIPVNKYVSTYKLHIIWRPFFFCLFIFLSIDFQIMNRQTKKEWWQNKKLFYPRLRKTLGLLRRYITIVNKVVHQMKNICLFSQWLLDKVHRIICKRIVRMKLYNSNYNCKYVLLYVNRVVGGL